MSTPIIRNLRCYLAYDGTHYLGFQIQPKGPTIQGILQEILSQILGHKVKIRSAGRTDAGVHALCQVVQFLTTSNKPLEVIFKALNGLLPKDISLWLIEEVDFKFHPQRDVIKKTYEYLIYNHPVRNPLIRLYSWWIPTPLNIPLMEECLSEIIGTKDFASFKKSGSDIKTTIRTIYSAQFKWSKEIENLLIFEISGKGFMRYMVRNIVGALVEVGKEKITKEDFKLIMEARDRKVAPPPAPPQGLILKKYRLQRNLSL